MYTPKLHTSITEIVRVNFLPIAITTFIGSLVAGGIGGAWAILVIAFRLPSRVSAVENNVGEIKSITDNLPKSYVSIVEYRDNITEIKDDVKTLLKIHLK